MGNILRRSPVHISLTDHWGSMAVHVRVLSASTLYSVCIAVNSGIFSTIYVVFMVQNKHSKKKEVFVMPLYIRLGLESLCMVQRYIIYIFN